LEFTFTVKQHILFLIIRERHIGGVIYWVRHDRKLRLVNSTWKNTVSTQAYAQAQTQGTNVFLILGLRLCHYHSAVWKRSTALAKGNWNFWVTLLSLSKRVFRAKLLLGILLLNNLNYRSNQIIFLKTSLHEDSLWNRGKRLTVEWPIKELVADFPASEHLNDCRPQPPSASTPMLKHLMRNFGAAQ